MPPHVLSGVAADDDPVPLVRNSSLNNLATQLFLASAYLVAGKIGLTLAFVNSSATAVWPPTGIALAAVLILGPHRAWPGIFVGAFLLNQITAGSSWTSLAIAGGNTAEALVGAYLVNRFAGGPTGLSRITNLILFAVLAGLLSTTVSATVGVTALYLAGYATAAAYLSIWTTWWLGDAAGAILVAPAVLLWHAAPRPHWSRPQRVEIVFLAFTTVLVAWTVFVIVDPPLTFLCIPVCIWAGMRFGQREASTTACALSAIAVWGTIRGHGALASASLNMQLLLLQAFVATSGMVGLAVGATVNESNRVAREARRLNDELEQRVEARTAELQRAYEVVRRSEGRLQTIIDAQPACVKLVSIDGLLLDMNRAGLEMVGAGDISQLKGRPIVDLVHQDDRSRYLEMHRAVSSGSPGRMEFRITGLNGGDRFVDSSAVPFDTPVDGSATQRAVLSVVTDITERKQLEEQLRQASKMEAIGQLAGGVAHDFNNMLAIILGYSELLSEQIGPDKPIGQDLRQITAAAERAAVLTRQLLAFSRKQVFSVVPVDVSSVVRTVKPMLQRLLGERITVTTALADDLVSVMADTAQLEHLLINLSVNARDAMPEGGELTFTTANVTLDATFTRDHPDAIIGSYAMVSVADTGIGMSAAVQARIFEPFFTTKESGRGTGLGLAAAYGTVKQLGGYIQVESRLGRGSTFSLYLPKTTRTAPPPRVDKPASAHGGNETILLVEDESGVRAFLKLALQRFGYHVIEADTAEAALILLKGYPAPVHLLLTDIVLPGMDGTELAVHVTRERPHTLVLFMSGYARGLGSTAGALDPDINLLEKPFTAQALLAKTRQVLGIHAGQNAS
jgi:PAS domain S-box-containing protein